jgi:hypothetical protein
VAPKITRESAFQQREIVFLQIERKPRAFEARQRLPTTQDPAEKPTSI